MTNARIWDASSVAAMDAITTKYQARGKHVETIGLNAACPYARAACRPARSQALISGDEGLLTYGEL